MGFRFLNSCVVSVRNHGGIPDIDASAYEVEIGGLVGKPATISLADLQDPLKFPYVSNTPLYVTFSLSDTDKLKLRSLFSVVERAE